MGFFENVVESVRKLLMNLFHNFVEGARIFLLSRLNHKNKEKSLFGDPPKISVTFMSPL